MIAVPQIQRGTRTKAKMEEMRRQLLDDKSIYSRLVEVLSGLGEANKKACVKGA
jgi:hypothetical protein